MYKFITLLLLCPLFSASAVEHPARISATGLLYPDYLNLAIDPESLEQLLRDVADSASNTGLKLRDDLPIRFNPKDMKDDQDWKRKYFDLVVVIDKAPKVQKAYIYHFGRFERTFKISTGREQVEYADPQHRPHHPTHDTVSETYTGYFSPTLLDISHVSSTYEDSEMPYSVFFNLTDGEATHQAPPGTEKLLGRRSSGGCVRLTKSDASKLFWYVRFTGGPLTKNELDQPLFGEEAKPWVDQGWKTSASMPKIPDFTIEGELRKDKKGIPIMHNGYRTLFVVQNSAYVAPKK